MSSVQQGEARKDVLCRQLLGILRYCSYWEISVKESSRSRSPRGTTVQQDWRAWLPEEKAAVFHKQESHLESLYNMFSVSLDEAIGLSLGGFRAKSLRALSMTSELCKLLTGPLTGMLRALREHAKHYGTIPNAAPLDPANYQRHKGQRSARMSVLLNRVLLSQRLQFLHKVNTLEEMVEDLCKDFRMAAGDLADGVSLHPDHLWEEVGADHYDLNTCLREAIVLFKSFLVVLPVDQLGAFQKAVCEQSQVPASDLPTHQRVIRHRRTPAIAGE